MAWLPETLKALIFDFDGTLAAGRYDFRTMRDRVCALAARYGVAPSALEGLYTLEAADRAAAIIGANGGDAQAFCAQAQRIIRAVELRGARRSRLLPGAAQALAALRGHGYRVAVVTRNCRAAIDLIPGAAALPCDAFLSRESVPHAKPHPQHLRAALTAVACVPEDGAMVGDHPMDIAAGKALGMMTVGVLTGAGTRETLAGADLIVDSVTSLTQVLLRRGGPENR